VGFGTGTELVQYLDLFSDTSITRWGSDEVVFDGYSELINGRSIIERRKGETYQNHSRLGGK